MTRSSSFPASLTTTVIPPRSGSRSDTEPRRSMTTRGPWLPRWLARPGLGVDGKECTRMPPDPVDTPAIGADFHEKLIGCLDYVQKFAAAYMIFHLFDQGIYRELQAGTASAADLAGRLSLEPALLTDFLEYCRIEGVVEREGKGFRLSAFGETLAPYRGWFDFFVGGYGETFRAVGSSLKLRA